MGLDMYAYVTAEKPSRPVDFEVKVAHRMFYWRKHPDLHGWMQRLYVRKGGTDETFNCVPVLLTAKDLDRLEADVQAGSLPHTEGFFFGASDGSETEDDLAFITRAREALARGLTVYYDAWW
ncbi:MAG: phosphoglycerate kinase [Spartobacteria bacterium]|nr:phosphoglycerate kinase [Spartobacteria bacterium]